MKSIKRAGETLKLMASQKSDLTVADTSRHLKVTPATASRILASLRDCGIIQQDPVTRRYRPGVLAFRLARAFESELGAIGEIQKSLDALVQRTQHSAWAGVLEGTEVVVLKSQNGSYPIRYALPPDAHLPASGTSLGKALLALKPPDEVKHLYKGGKFGGTERAHSSLRSLLEDLESIRQRGYAISDQELFNGIKSVSVAFDSAHLDRPVAFGISYPIFSLAEGEEDRIIGVLLDEARQYEASTGDPGLKQYSRRDADAISPARSSRPV